MLETTLTVSTSIIAFIILIFAVRVSVQIGVEEGVKAAILELIGDKEFEFKINRELSDDEIR